MQADGSDQNKMQVPEASREVTAKVTASLSLYISPTREHLD